MHFVLQNKCNGNVTFGNVFAHGFKTTAAVTVIMVVYTIIAIKFIFPEIMEMAMTEGTEGMEEKNMSDDQIEQALNFTRKFFVPLSCRRYFSFFYDNGSNREPL